MTKFAGKGSLHWKSLQLSANGFRSALLHMGVGMKRGLVQIPLVLERESTVPLQRQIVIQTRNLIERGVLSPGTALPSIRDLSKELKIARNTVILAFQRLAEEGYINIRQGAVPVVAATPPMSSPRQGVSCVRNPPIASTILPKMARIIHEPRAIRPNRYAIDFRLGETAPELFPRECWQDWLNVLMRHSSGHYAVYPDPVGLSELRSAIAEHVGIARGIVAGERDVVIVQGIQEALSLLSWIFIRNGRQVLMESPGHRGTYNLFKAFGAQVHFLSVDENGIDPNSIPDGDFCFLHTTPSHQYPTGVTLSNDRRNTLLAWAYRNGAYIIESDYDADFRYADVPLPAIAAHDRSQVIYIGTLSKCFGPGVRLGYMVCPSGLSEEIVKAKALLNNGCSWLEQAVVARMMRSGEFGAHLRYIRRIYAERCDRLVKVLLRFGGQVFGAEGGMHLSWQLPGTGPDAHYIESRLREHGVKVYCAEEMAVFSDAEKRLERTLFFGFASVSDEGLDTLASALEKILLG